jgi:ribosome recycling factor
MSLNPTTDGAVVSVMMPKPSAEARDNLIKLAGKTAEKVCLNFLPVTNDNTYIILILALHCILYHAIPCYTMLYQFKQEVRQCRKDGMDAVKKQKSKLSEDVVKRFTKEVSHLLT